MEVLCLLTLYQPPPPHPGDVCSLTSLSYSIHMKWLHLSLFREEIRPSVQERYPRLVHFLMSLQHLNPSAPVTKDHTGNSKYGPLISQGRATGCLLQLSKSHSISSERTRSDWLHGDVVKEC